MIQMCSVYDQAAKRFLDPFPAPTVEFAIRGFKEACITEGHQFNKFPEDYVLFWIGTFDPDTGEIQDAGCSKISMALDHVSAGSLKVVNDA